VFREIFSKVRLRFIGRLCALIGTVAGGLIAPPGAQGASALLKVNMSTIIQNDFLGVTCPPKIGPVAVLAFGPMVFPPKTGSNIVREIR